ncbi:hypothetical protein PAECIP111893_00406 [Paenibacillus plantiphilus]|uniref:Uncharacterized protein n=1 Tax=Paenibacillus plantiphilus TaxID=2905650 RepID=A0ABM9BTU8_9BACL|nr:hypothetical protein PAECIP111893_00406 [Paenibacillus plantiphilus]
MTAPSIEALILIRITLRSRRGVFDETSTMDASYEPSERCLFNESVNHGCFL